MSTSETSDITRIREVAARLTRLAHSRCDIASFYQQFLDLLPVPAEALGTTAWLKQGNAYRSLARGSRNPPQGIPLPYSNERHADYLGRVATRGDWEILAPQPSETAGSTNQSTGPALAIFPVVRSGETAYIVEVFLDPQMSDDAMRRFGLLTDTLCGIAAAYHQLAATTATSTSSQTTNTPAAGEPAPIASSLDFAREVHRSLDPIETCFAIANEGRPLIGCDRVAVLIRQGTRFKVQAVSSHDEVNPRANVIQSLQRLVERTMAIAEPFWYPHPNPHLAPEIEEALERHIEASLCRVLGIVPLFAAAPYPLHGGETPALSSADRTRQVVGAIVIEQFSDNASSLPLVQDRAESVSHHAGVALGNALQHDHIFLLPLWRRLGSLRTFLFGTNKSKTWSILILLIAASIGLIAVPAELKVTSEGRLRPVLRRNIFAPWDGTVAHLHVNHNDVIDNGSPLIDLRNEVIELEIQRLQGEIATSERRLAAIRAQRVGVQSVDRQQPSPPDTTSIEQQDLERLVQSLSDQLKIQLERRAQLAIVSPIAGQVLTWNVEELLQDRPVRRGQLLMEVANLKGDWHLELDVPDRRTLHVLRAKADSQQPLTVTFLVASDPQHRYLGTLTDITRATSVNADVGQHVRATVAIDAKQLPFLQPGTKVQAKIHCGKRSLGYVWFHQLWEFVQSRILFRMM